MENGEQPHLKGLGLYYGDEKGNVYGIVGSLNRENRGQLLRITPDGNQELFGIEGKELGPFSAGSNGYFYGVEYHSNTTGIYRIRPDGSDGKIIHTFAGPPLDVDYVTEPPVLVGSTLFGRGQAGSDPVVYEIPAAGGEMSLHKFDDRRHMPVVLFDGPGQQLMAAIPTDHNGNQQALAHFSNGKWEQTRPLRSGGRLESMQVYENAKVIGTVSGSTYGSGLLISVALAAVKAQELQVTHTPYTSAKPSTVQSVQYAPFDGRMGTAPPPASSAEEAEPVAKTGASNASGKNHHAGAIKPAATAPGAAESKSEPANLTAHDNSSPAGGSTDFARQNSPGEESYGSAGRNDEEAGTFPEPATAPEVHPLSTVFDNGPYADYNSYSRRQILKRAQRKLRQAGLYHSGIDGAMGPGTQAAIIAWQQQENIPVTGLLDEQTLQSMSLLGLAEQTPPRKPIVGEPVREYPQPPDPAEVISRVLQWIPH